jgi:hypothetical protein
MYHSMCTLPGLNMMIAFGGTDTPAGAFNKVNTFDLEKGVWDVQLQVGPGAEGSVPSARKGHTAVCLNNTMVVYGKCICTSIPTPSKPPFLFPSPFKALLVCACFCFSITLSFLLCLALTP